MRFSTSRHKLVHTAAPNVNLNILRINIEADIALIKISSLKLMNNLSK